jgi:hypothetical protein
MLFRDNFSGLLGGLLAPIARVFGFLPMEKSSGLQEMQGPLSFRKVPLSPGSWLAFGYEGQTLTICLSFIFLSFDLQLLVVNTQKVSSASLEFTATLISSAPQVKV